MMWSELTITTWCRNELYDTSQLLLYKGQSCAVMKEHSTGKWSFDRVAPHEPGRPGTPAWWLEPHPDFDDVELDPFTIASAILPFCEPLPAGYQWKDEHQWEDL